MSMRICSELTTPSAESSFWLFQQAGAFLGEMI
jgi:hypothetical protein